MKKNFLMGGLIIASVFGLAVSRYSNDAKITFHIKNTMYPNGIGIAGNTGAPGESTCKSCHGSSIQMGGTESSLTITDSVDNAVNEYVPNHTYKLTFKNTSPGSKGFQITCLTEGAVKAGSFIAGGTTRVLSANSRQYLNHNNSSNSSWSFQWKAPASDQGKLIFYVATGGKGTIFTSKYSITAKAGQGGGDPTASIRVNENAFGFFAFYSNDTKNVFMRYTAPTDGKGFVNVVDLQGKSVHYSELGAVKQGVNTKELDLPINMQSGTYVVQLFVNNYFATKQIVVVR